MKRPREEGEVDVNLARLLMLLSSSAAEAAAAAAAAAHPNAPQASGRVFECKTCNRQFPSFQALGGHRASHKKPRPPDEAGGADGIPPHPPKPRVHECSICGLEFALGQALGGHMRRHRAVLEGGTSALQHHERGTKKEEVAKKAATKVAEEVKREEKGKKGGGVAELDLNAPPLENDPLLTFSLGLPLVFL